MAIALGGNEQHPSPMDMRNFLFTLLGERFTEIILSNSRNQYSSTQYCDDYGSCTDASSVVAVLNTRVQVLQIPVRSEKLYVTSWNISIRVVR